MKLQAQRHKNQLDIRLWCGDHDENERKIIGQAASITSAITII
jgi:hypothetical protein